MVLLRGSALDGCKLEMFDKETNKLLEEFESIGKALRFCGLSRGSRTGKLIYSRKPIEIIYKGSKKIVYFKEKF